MRGIAFCSVRIALDPNQFRRPAADVEQDGAPPVRVKQRRTTGHRQRCFGLAIDHFKPDAGLGRHPVHEAVGIRRRAAGFGGDQTQAFGPLRLDLVAADAEGGDGAVDRGVADAAGRRDPLPEPDDARERVDHAKAVTGRTGDQQPAIVGAKVQRGIDAGCRRRRMARAGRATVAQLLSLAATRRAMAVVSARLRALAKPRVLVHSKYFPRPLGADVEFPFTETLAAPDFSATAVHMPPCPIRRCRCRYRCVI